MNSRSLDAMPAPSGATIRPSSDILCSFLDHHEIAALLVDVSTLEIVWSSQASVELDRRLCAGARLYDVPEIGAVLPKQLERLSGTSRTLLPGDNIGMLGRCTLRPVMPVEREDRMDSSAEAVGISISLKFVSRHGDRQLLQIEREQPLGNYYRQYVAEQEKLFNTSRALTVNEMATTLAHELNQPIGTVVNLLHGCLDRLKSYNESRREETHEPVDSDVMEALDFAIRQSRFASQIIARIREFTEARQPRIEKQDIRAIVQESVQLLDWVFESEGINLSLQLGAQSLCAGCDRMLLQQVIVNLCRNAVEAMRGMPHSERQLILQAYQSDDGVHLDIIDRGPGMTEAAMRDMFKPFVTNKRQGMGIGLNICRSFIELHQGKLWITHNQEQGCAVHIRLPKLSSATESTVSAGGSR